MDLLPNFLTNVMSIYQANKIEGRCFTVFLREDSILQIDIDENSYFEKKDFEELRDAAGLIGKGEKFLNLIKVGKGTLLDDKARKLSSSVEGCIYKLADAFVITSYAQQLIANFIIIMNRPPVPTSFFTDEDEAVKWLKELQLKDQ